METFKDARTAYLLAAKERRELAKQLREGGMSFEQIGKKLGVSRQRVHAMVNQ